MKYKFIYVGLASLIMSINSVSYAALITFDDAITGQTSFGFDGDGDLIDDTIFSTLDPSGFNTAGPGPNQLYISEPGLEGTTLLSPDLRVDFLNGAVNSLSFGFAIIDGAGIDGVTFSIFDSSDNLLNSTFQVADFTLPDGINPSGFPEAFVTIGFNNIASYAIFDFSNTLASRYLMDNFSGTFGSTEDITPSIPEPSALAIFALAITILVSRRIIKHY